MSPSAIYEDDLRQLIRAGRAVLVAGTGVSIAASSHPQASWTGLLGSGIEWLESHKLMAADEVEAHRTLLLKPKTRRLISTAQDIVEEMGGDGSKHFADWLERTVGSIRAKDRRVLDALDALRQHGHLLATTNYDGLLLSEPPVLDAITWQETDELVRVVQSWDTSHVIFLHGYWRKPGSVVLDWDSYRRIAEDQQYRQDLRALWTTHTWVYVGCGVDGLSDPDLGLLLERYGRRARRGGHWDYCLVRGEEQRQEFQAYFDTQDFNVRAVSFGERFDDLPDFLRSLLPDPVMVKPVDGVMAEDVASKSGGRERVIPKPPDFYAEPPYIGSHQFVGRRAELDQLDDWASAADPTNILLFEAIGGNGKSMLTWEWMTRHATTARSDWAGRFWYSFYERGAIMQDFCQRALAYMTGRPLKEFRKLRTGQMAEDLIAELRARPWLLVLDGLERVLVAYHRIDAAEIPDEAVDDPTDKVLNRDPRDTIRDEDTDLLRSLAGCSPSKVAVSSRLAPRALLNSAGQPLPGVRRIALSGLRPADAEALLRSCRVVGEEVAIRDYLQQNCDNHPLVIGVIGGLINQPGPRRGDFDAWSVDPTRGALLDLAELNLAQRRNNILKVAMNALPEASRQLLDTLALLSESVEYKTLEALNPHLSPEVQNVETLGQVNDKDRVAEERGREIMGTQRVHPVRELGRQCGPEDPYLASKKLVNTIEDLEIRGFLQYESRGRRYDLHPVVRGVVAGSMSSENKERYGVRVVDYFSSQSRLPYEDARSLEEISPGLHLVRTFQKLGRYKDAAKSYRGILSRVLFFKFEAHSEIVALLRPFFPRGWGVLPEQMRGVASVDILNDAALAMVYLGNQCEAIVGFQTCLQSNLNGKRWENALTSINNMTRSYMLNMDLASASRCSALAEKFSAATGGRQRGFVTFFLKFSIEVVLGRRSIVEEIWGMIDSMERPRDRNIYREGQVEFAFAEWCFREGTIRPKHFEAAFSSAKGGGSRTVLRSLYRIKGLWRLKQGYDVKATSYLKSAVEMARERGIQDAESETGLVLAKLLLGRLTEKEAKDEAERLAHFRQPAYRYLAMLWKKLGNFERAKQDALKAYGWAWADGEPYVDRYGLDQSTELLWDLNVPIPNLPPFDSSKVEPFPWEADVLAAIEKIRAEKEAEENGES